MVGVVVFSNFWSQLRQSFVSLQWEEANALTDLRHDSQNFHRWTEFSWKPVSAFLHPTVD